MADIQYQWDGQRGREFYDKQKVVRLTDTLCRDFSMASIRVGMKESELLRMFIRKFCDRINNYPPEMRKSASREIDGTTENVITALPEIRRDLQVNPRVY
jgi:hypothetical protein